jgi:hypothetical protein
VRRLVGSEMCIRDSLTAAFSIAQGPCSLPEALALTEENLEKTAYFVGALGG